MGTMFASPEEKIILQGSTEKDEDGEFRIYFIINGDCVMNYVDHNRQQHIAYRTLVEGDHFGEIGVLYRSTRTATILSRNYNMMATVTRRRFLSLKDNYPSLFKLIEKHIFKVY